MERDISEEWKDLTEEISTHTLMWSVTAQAVAQGGTLQISTHTLMWSVTIALSIATLALTFQLTRSCGA